MSQQHLFHSTRQPTTKELIEAALHRAKHGELSSKQLRQKVLSDITRASYYEVLAMLIDEGTVSLTDDGYRLIPEEERNGIPQDSNSMETRS